VDFDASSPAGCISMLDVSVLDLSGPVLPMGGPLSPPNMPLAATDDGRLFTLSFDPGGGPNISQVDPFTGNAIAQVDVPVTWDDLGHPFAFWAGDFYTFLPEPADAGVTIQTDVVRLHPGATTRETVTRIEGVVAAASNSPCAPTQ
jgi:hypothetical protein